jgi:hypothetical protein
MSKRNTMHGLCGAVLCLILATSAQGALVAHWHLDGGAGDATGNGHDGTLTNVAFTPSVAAALGTGQAGDFNGNAWVHIPADPALNSSAFTLSFWINQNGATQNGAHERTTSRQSDTFETSVNGSGTLDYYPAPGPNWQSTGYPIQPTGWQHLAYVSDGATMKLYAGGKEWFSGSFAGSPSGFMRIGARHNNTEGIQARMDDVALWDAPLTQQEVQAVAGGMSGPAELHKFDFTTTTVQSIPADWSLSTVRESGGGLSDWTGPFGAPPAAGTFTLAASPGTKASIINAGNDIGSGGTLLGYGAGPGVQYYRTLFELPEFSHATANLALAVDNGARVWINGVEIARETSFLAENWARPYSTLTINANGTIGGVTLFDWTASSFTGWLPGENELILAIRNPDTEGADAGAIAFRMDVLTSIPEPGTLSLLGLGGLALLRRRRRRR